MTARGLGVGLQLYKMLKRRTPVSQKKMWKIFFLRKNVEEKRKPRGENSFVAPHAHWEYQVDLFFISTKDLENQQFRIGLVLIDIFSKYATVILIKSKEPPDVLAGTMEGLQKMGDKPKMFYSDEEGSLYSKTVIEYLEGEKN